VLARSIENIDPVIPDVVIAPNDMFDPVRCLSANAGCYNACSGNAGGRHFSYHLQWPVDRLTLQVIATLSCRLLRQYGCYKVIAVDLLMFETGTAMENARQFVSQFIVLLKASFTWSDR
jgi:hypothetical protein